MLTKVFVGVGIVVAMTGCADDGGSETEPSTTEQMLSSNITLPSGVLVPNSLGTSTTVSSAAKGRIDLGNAFFQDLGTNDRRCVSCHLPTAGWGITPGQMQAIFNSTNGGAIDDGFGLGAVFRTNDGANSPNAPVGTLAERRAAYSMLLTRGTIRVGIGMPAGAEFALDNIDDPYEFATESELSLFRRPLPSTNLTMIPQVMWDGRVSFGNPTATVNEALADQSNGATMGHAQALEPISQTLRTEIVGFETGLFSGRALITGKWADMNKFKVPSLRALGARAPYFHGGSANTLEEVVELYEESLHFAFTAAERADMVAFLAAL